MKHFLNNLPAPLKIFVAFVITGLLVAGFLNAEFFSSFLSQSTEKETGTAEKADEITVRLNVRNKETQKPEGDVKVELTYLGAPVTAYTDSAGYVDLKIPRTSTVMIYLSKPKFKSANYQLDPKLNIPSDRNLTYYLSPDTESSNNDQFEPNSVQDPTTASERSVVQRSYGSGSNISAGRDVHFNEAPKSLETVQDSVALALKKGMSYKEGRQILIDKGWQPIFPGYLGAFPDLNDPTIKHIFEERGYQEVESCSGTGLGFCSFKFSNGRGKELLVTTVNNQPGDDITVWTWSFN